MPKTLHTVNEGMAFLLELVALVGLGAWGFHVGGSLAVHVALGIGAPAVMIVIWMMFCAPRAKVRLPIAGLFALRTLILLAASGAMDAAGWHVVAVVVAILVLANAAIVSFDRTALISER